MRFKDHFSKLAREYAAFRPRYPSALFAHIAAESESTDIAWDCACGSGQATRSLAEHYERVIATGASAAQIASTEPHPRVEYRVAPAESSGLGDASVDAVTVAQALHWFDVDRFYAEARRVLKPGGVVAVWTYGIAQVQGREVEQRLAEFYERIDPWWPPERRLVETGYRTLAFPFDERPTPSWSMEAHWTLAMLAGYLRSWSAVGRYAEATGEDPVADLEGKLASVWGDSGVRRVVSWPLSVRLGKA